MTDEMKIYLIAVIGIIVGLALFFQGLKKMKLKRTIQNTPTSKVRSIAMGLVELIGKAAPFQQTIKSPFSQADCVFYKYTVEEYKLETTTDSDGNTKTEGRWEEIQSGRSDNLLCLEDDTGTVPVNPDRAEVAIPVDRVITSSDYGNFASTISAFFDSQSIIFGSTFGRQLRFTEHYIEPGDPLYVLGTAERNPDAAPASGSSGANVIIKKGANDPVFYISDKGEKGVLKSLSWQAPLYVFGGALVTLACIAALAYGISANMAK